MTNQSCLRTGVVRTSASARGWLRQGASWLRGAGHTKAQLRCVTLCVVQGADTAECATVGRASCNSCILLVKTVACISLLGIMFFRFRPFGSAQAKWGKVAKPGPLGSASPLAYHDALRSSCFYPAEFNLQTGEFDVAHGEESALSSDDTILAPVDDSCHCIWAAGLNYKKHCQETGMDSPRFPTLFMKSTNAITVPHLFCLAIA